MHGFKNLVATQAGKKGGGTLVPFHGGICGCHAERGPFHGDPVQCLVFWNQIIRMCKKFKLCGVLIKKKKQAPSFLQIEASNLKAYFPSTVAFYEEMCVLLRKESEK